jgi:pilus assembly protein CpaB
VSLEVTPRQAELVAVAATLGKMTLALRGAVRNPEQSPAALPAGATVWAGDVMRSLFQLSPAPAAHAGPAAQVMVLRGTGARQAK